MTVRAGNRSLRLIQGAPEPSRVPPPSRPSLDDVEILEALRRGDASAASALHDRARPRVDRTIVRILGHRDPEHDELAQIAMIELVMTIDRFRGECSLDTWIGRVTAHAVFNELRRRRVRRRVFAIDFDESAIDRPSPGDLERSISDREVLARVRRHLDAIDAVKAWTVMLHDVIGHDLREIAEITETTVMAAQQRLVRGRRELRTRLLDDPALRGLFDEGGAR